MASSKNAEPQPIPEAYRDLVDRPLLMTLATTLPDGTPQATPVWFNYEDGYIYFNTARGRLKDRAIRNNPNVALLFLDPDDGNRWLAIRGPVVAITEQDAREHINALALRYTGQAFGGTPTETRVKLKVLPLHVTVASHSMPDKPG